jgi:hypothetical protein
MRIRRALTILYIRFIRRGRFEHIEPITLLDGNRWDVYLYSSSSKIILGQATPWATIIISQRLFEDKPLFNLVTLHESRHVRQWFEWWLLIFLALALVLFSTNSRYGFAILTLFITIFWSWFIELDAEFYTIKYAGLTNYERVTEQFKHKSRLTARSLVLTIWALLTHPPRTLTIWLYRLTHRDT